MNEQKIDKEASQARPSVACALSRQAPYIRAARPDPSLRKKRLLRMTFLPDCNQKLALAWKERMGGDLTLEAGGPAAGDWGCAVGASRVFPFADHAGEIAGVDVAKSGLAADFDGAQQVFGVGVARIGHLIVAVEGGDVPGNVGGDLREEFGEAAEFVGVVVEAGDQERHDFEPQSRLMDAADAIENGSDAAAEFVVVAVVKTFEIDFVQIEPGAQVFENLGSGVAVGDEAGDESGGFGLLEDGYGPLAGDERLVVGADQNLRALGDGVADQEFGRGFERRGDGMGIAQSLRCYPVLTIGAVQIAAQHAEAVG